MAGQKFDLWFESRSVINNLAIDDNYYYVIFWDSEKGDIVCDATKDKNTGSSEMWLECGSLCTPRAYLTCGLLPFCPQLTASCFRREFRCGSPRTWS